ncbi:MAG TPA: DUF1416 domain-containing protein [Nocardioidaceae bacterium]|nr:DUF1416 domain-containing protein [Nocardioidaceae bacterium]
MSCGAPADGDAGQVDAVDPSGQAVITGRVVDASGQPLAGAYVRLLDSTGEFAGEVPAGDTGQFRFFAAGGNWTVRAVTSRSAPVDVTVSAVVGQAVEARIAV